MKRFLYPTVPTAVLVVLVLLGIPFQTTAAPPAQSGGEDMGCAGGINCIADFVGGTLACIDDGQCTSEGSQSGSYRCNPGTAVAVCECQEGNNCVIYICDDGIWKEIRSSVASPEWCGYACIYDVTGTGIGTICWELTREETDFPCEDLDWGANGIQCIGKYGLTVSVRVPCQRIGRVPYPRGMVLVPNRMWFLPTSPSWAESWSQTLDYNACLEKNISSDGRRVRNYRIGLAWSRENIPPYWEVETVGGFRGWSIQASWERSSWGRERCGPGLRAGEKLPAFRVRVFTYWTPYWRRVYERQKRETRCVWSEAASSANSCECIPPGYTGSCEDDTNRDGIRDWAGWVNRDELCSDDSNGDGIPDDHCWETVDSGWQAIDLRRFGYPTPYFVSAAAGGVPTPQDPNPQCTGLCIPVIEVQGLIENPRSPQH